MTYCSWKFGEHLKNLEINEIKASYCGGDHVRLARCEAAEMSRTARM
jgi:hypothetical protein